jgi:hypothetical protein
MLLSGLNAQKLLERFTHQRRVGSDIGPELECNRGLVDEHAEPIERCAAAVTGFAQQPRVGGIKDHIGDNKPGPQTAPLHSHTRVAIEQPDRCRVDQNVGLGGNREVFSPLDESGRGGCFVAKQIRELLATLCGSINDGDFRRTGQSQLDRNRPRRTSCAKYGDFLSGGIGDSAQRLQKPL